MSRRGPGRPPFRRQRPGGSGSGSHLPEDSPSRCRHSHRTQSIVFQCTWGHILRIRRPCMRPLRGSLHRCRRRGRLRIRAPRIAECNRHRFPVRRGPPVRSFHRCRCIHRLHIQPWHIRGCRPRMFRLRRPFRERSLRRTPRIHRLRRAFRDSSGCTRRIGRQRRTRRNHSPHRTLRTRRPRMSVPCSLRCSRCIRRCHIWSSRGILRKCPRIHRVRRPCQSSRLCILRRCL